MTEFSYGGIPHDDAEKNMRLFAKHALPVLQNDAHVSALEGFLGDLRVPVCGYVVSAGRARFAPEIADAVVCVRDLPWVLSIVFAEPSRRVLDAAWRRLEGEAAKSPGRSAAHEAYARWRRDAFQARRQA